MIPLERIATKSGSTPVERNSSLPAPLHSVTARWLLLAAAAIPLVFAWLHFHYAPPVISHDTAIGLLTWRSMQDGADWNHLEAPNPTDISRSTGGYLSWWSPGQYLPVGLLMACGLSLGGAVIVTSLVGAWSLASGLWQLGLSLGAAPIPASLAALAAASTWHTLYAFGFFIGGEVVLLAVWPWIVLIAWRTRERPRLQLLVLPLLFLVGSYAKLSFSILAAGLLLFLWIETGRAKQWQTASLTRNGLYLAGSAAIYTVAWYWLHLSRGDTPANPAGVAASPATILGFAGAGPWFATTGLSSLAGRVFAQWGIASDTGWERFRLALLVLGLAGGIGSLLLLQAHLALYRLAGIMAFVSPGLLAFILLRGGSVSLEDRHFRPAGVLLLAVAAGVAGDPSHRRPLRLVAGTALALGMAFGLAAGLQRMANLRENTIRSAGNIAAIGHDRTSLLYLEQLDQRGRLIYIPDVMQSPLISRARTLVTDATNENLAGLAAQTWHGRVPRLALMLPAAFNADERAATIRAGFKDYASSEWRMTRAGSWCFWEVGSP